MGEGRFAKRSGVRGLYPRRQTPHPARTAHSRCAASAFLLENGGREAAYGHLLPQGEKEVLPMRHDGQITEIVSSLAVKNNSLYQNSDLHYKSTQPEPPKGAMRIVT